MAASATGSLKSSDFAIDHEIVHQMFDEMRVYQVRKNHKELARSLISLVDMLREMTTKKEEYENYDAKQLEKAKNKAF